MEPLEPSFTLGPIKVVDDDVIEACKEIRKFIPKPNTTDWNMYMTVLYRKIEYEHILGSSSFLAKILVNTSGLCIHVRISSPVIPKPPPSLDGIRYDCSISTPLENWN